MKGNTTIKGNCEIYSDFSISKDGIENRFNVDIESGEIQFIQNNTIQNLNTVLDGLDGGTIQNYVDSQL